MLTMCVMCDWPCGCGSAVLRFCGSAVLRFCGSAVLRFCGAVLRFCGSAVLRFCGSAVLRFCGSAVLRFCGSAVLRFCGSAAIRGYGSAVIRGYGSAAIRGYGSAAAMLARSTAMHVRTLHVTCDDANDYHSRLHTLNACTRIRECERVCMRARTRACMNRIDRQPQTIPSSDVNSIPSMSHNMRNRYVSSSNSIAIEYV